MGIYFGQIIIINLPKIKIKIKIKPTNKYLKIEIPNWGRNKSDRQERRSDTTIANSNPNK